MTTPCPHSLRPCPWHSVFACGHRCPVMIMCDLGVVLGGGCGRPPLPALQIRTPKNGANPSSSVSTLSVKFTTRIYCSLGPSSTINQPQLPFFFTSSTKEVLEFHSTLDLMNREVPMLLGQQKNAHSYLYSQNRHTTLTTWQLCFHQANVILLIPCLCVFLVTTGCWAQGLSSRDLR